MMQASGLATVPLDLGAEWIHSNPKMLGQIAGPSDTDMGVETIDESPHTYGCAPSRMGGIATRSRFRRSRR